MKIIIAIIVTFVVTALIVGVVLVIKSSPSKADFDPLATPVRLESPQRGDLAEIVSAPGDVEPMTKVSIAARVSARIVDLPYREGKVVIKGDPSANPPVAPSVLVKLDDTDLKASLKAEESRREAQVVQIEVAKARLITQQAAIKSIRVSYEDAKRTLKNELELHKSKVNSQDDVDRAQCMVDKLASDLEGAENSLKADEKNLQTMQHVLNSLDADVARARDSLTYTEIVAPIDGVVTLVKAEVGEVVIPGTMNNMGTSIMQVADLDHMLVIAQVDETDIGSVKVGQRAKVKMQAYANKVFDGTVDSISLVQGPQMMGRGKYYQARVLLNLNGQRILSGLTADVDIETMRHENVLTVPTQAILGRRVDDLPTDIRDKPEVEKEKAQTPVVYRFVNGKAVATPVKLGAVDATRSVILAGLSESDKIIVGPYKILENLRHEQSVRDERAGKSAGTQAASQPATARATQPASASQPSTAGVEATTSPAVAGAK